VAIVRGVVERIYHMMSAQADIALQRSPSSRASPLGSLRGSFEHRNDASWVALVKPTDVKRGKMRKVEKSVTWQKFGLDRARQRETKIKTKGVERAQKIKHNRRKGKWYLKNY